MTRIGRHLLRASVWGMLLLAATGGCATPPCAAPLLDVPRELAKVSLPPYVIESPDILTINALRLVPRPPYKIEPLDTIGIRVTETLPEQPIQGVYGVEPSGKVNLGFNYGFVFVQGMTIEQAQSAIIQRLRRTLKPGYQVNVIEGESRGMQLIRGTHLVQTDGTVNLGLYGSVYVDNMTIPQAKEAIETHLAQFLVNPEIALTVSGYNSKVFYLITDGGGVSAEQIIRVPMMGKTTVLDALSQSATISGLGGLPLQASKHHISLVRPAPADSCKPLVLKVDYKGIVQRGETATNYQVLPGDRLYVKAAPLLTFDAYLARVLTPIGRLFGTAFETTGFISSVQAISGFAVGTATTTTTGPTGAAGVVR